jgi:hypothetical protein
MAMRRHQMSANSWRQAFAFVNAYGYYFGDCFFNHELNYGCETGFLPNPQISFWDKWGSREKALEGLNRFFLTAGFN